MRVVLPPLLLALVLGTAGPAGAVDVDRRLGERHDDRPSSRPHLGRLPVDLVAPPRPGARCMLVRVVPIARDEGPPGDDSLLYRPCDPAVETPPYKPYDERPPILIPQAPRR